MPFLGNAQRATRVLQGLAGAGTALSKLSDRGGVSSFPPVQRLFCGHPLASLEQKGMLAQLLRAGIRAILLRSPHSCTSPPPLTTRRD